VDEHITAKYAVTDINKNKKATFEFSFLPGDMKAKVQITISKVDDTDVVISRQLNDYPIQKVLKQVTKLSNASVLYSRALHLRGDVTIIEDMTQDEKNIIEASVVVEEL